MDFVLQETVYTTEEESLLEAAYKNSPLADPPEIELVKLGATLKKDRRHITDWFKQRRVNDLKKSDFFTRFIGEEKRCT